MGVNIVEVSGNSTGDPDNPDFTLDFSTAPGVTSISGDFNATTGGEATSYTFSPLSTNAYGTLTFNTTDGTFTFNVDWSAVLASGSNQTVTFTVTGEGFIFDDTAFVTVELLICVARGTMITTEHGDVPVETLDVGSKVTTLDGRRCSVRWVGSRKIGPQELANQPALQPICISAHTFGQDMPCRDLWVSPQHRIFLNNWRAELLFGESEVLVPAVALVNDKTIIRDTRIEEVEYFHLLFDEHEIILTEGLATESFHPGTFTMSALGSAVRTELLALFPDIADEDGYGPVVRPALRPWEGRVLAREEVA